MGMSPRLLRPRASSALVAVDADARAYINAVRIADGGKYMEPAVQRAIDAFVSGCKSDGIWSAIKASCILMGARTLSGALTPLVGSAPTNNGPFVSGDYNRKTGLLGNGTTKYLNANRNNNADPQDNQHLAIYVSSVPVATPRILAGCTGTNGRTAISFSVGLYQTRSRTQTATDLTTAATGFVGASRAASATYTHRMTGLAATVSQSSLTPENIGMGVFASAAGAAASDAGIAFYSIGESLNLALLDTRVSALYTAIGAAI